MKTVATLTRILSELAEEMESLENTCAGQIKEIAKLKAEKERLELDLDKKCRNR
jgi:cell division protein FtsB